MPKKLIPPSGGCSFQLFQRPRSVTLPSFEKKSVGSTGPTNIMSSLKYKKRSAKPSIRHSMLSMAYELKVGSNCS